MKTYKVYFEIFGKKMRTEIPASNPREARQKVVDKIIWHKIDEDDYDFGQSIFDILNKS